MKMASSDPPGYSSTDTETETETETERVVEMAGRVVKELEGELDYDDYLFHQKHEINDCQNKSENKSDEDEFDFAFVSTLPHFSPTIPADQIFYNGQIRPLYPLFNTDLLLDHRSQPDLMINTSISSATDSSAIRLPLAKLFIDERTGSSCSSSEADELEGVAAGSYCVWKSKAAEESSGGRCKKSGSTGTSKRWKFRHLLHRSNSDVRDSLVILANNKTRKKPGEEEDVNAEMKEISDRGGKWYVAYKKDVGVLGLFANVNGVSRSLRPF